MLGFQRCHNSGYFFVSCLILQWGTRSVSYIWMGLRAKYKLSIRSQEYQLIFVLVYYFGNTVHRKRIMSTHIFNSNILAACHYKWAPVTKAWRVLRMRIEERPPIWRVAANILNKQPWKADKGWSSSLRVGQGANNSSP